MSIENQIAVHADEPEQLSAAEFLSALKKDMLITIGNTTYDLDDITNLLCATMLRVAAEESITENAYAIEELYIKTIQEMME